jgi:hypothetical protein
VRSSPQYTTWARAPLENLPPRLAQRPPFRRSGNLRLDGARSFPEFPDTERLSSRSDRQRRGPRVPQGLPPAHFERPRRTECSEPEAGSDTRSLHRESQGTPRRSAPASTRRGTRPHRRKPRNERQPMAMTSSRRAPARGARTPDRRTARRSPACSTSSRGCGRSSQRFSTRTRAPRRSTSRSTTSPKKVMTQPSGHRAERSFQKVR